MSSDITKKIVKQIQASGTGLSSEVIAREYLKFQATGPMAEMLVAKVLLDDPRLLLVDGLWCADGTVGELLQDGARIICRCELSNDRQSIGAVSLWKIVDGSAQHLKTITLLESKEALLEIAPILEREPLLFFSQYEQRLLLRSLLGFGYSLSDDLLLISTLFKSAQCPMEGKKEGLLAVAQKLITIEKEPSNCKDEGELLVELTLELYKKSALLGIKSGDEFEKWQEQFELGAPWDKAQFSLADALNASEGPGVYGFKDSTTTILYVGKAKNLKRRLMSYFRISDESPAKLVALRQEAVSLMIHPCGSELEALIQEHRLIVQYQPKLNTQLQIHENKEGNSSGSTLYILESREDGCRMTLWYGPGGKIKLQNLSLDQISAELIQEIQVFMKKSDSTETSQEKEIAQRWLKVHHSEVAQISVDEYSSDEELLGSLREIFSAENINSSIYR